MASRLAPTVASCLFAEEQYDLSAAGGSKQGWAFPLIVCGTAFCGLLLLRVASEVERR